MLLHLSPYIRGTLQRNIPQATLVSLNLCENARNPSFVHPHPPLEKTELERLLLTRHLTRLSLLRYLKPFLKAMSAT
jgi:hypothetical protein